MKSLGIQTMGFALALLGLNGCNQSEQGTTEQKTAPMTNEVPATVPPSAATNEMPPASPTPSPVVPPEQPTMPIMPESTNPPSSTPPAQ